MKSIYTGRSWSKMEKIKEISQRLWKSCFLWKPYFHKLSFVISHWLYYTGIWLCETWPRFLCQKIQWMNENFVLLPESSQVDKLQDISSQMFRDIKERTLQPKTLITKYNWEAKTTPEYILIYKPNNRTRQHNYCVPVVKHNVTKYLMFA